MLSCKGCMNRHLGCHSSCEIYLDFRKMKDIEYEGRKLKQDSGYWRIGRKSDRRKC